MPFIPQFVLNSKAILNDCTYGICIADTQGVMRYTNRAFNKLTGLGSHYFLNLHVRDAVAKGIISDSSILRLLEGQTPSNALVSTMAGNQLFCSAFPVYDKRNSTIHLATVIRSAKGQGLLRELDAILSPAELYCPPETQMVGHSLQMGKVFNLAKRLSFIDCCVLIQGETGVGKGLLARAIHEQSARRSGPFVTVNCGAIPSQLIESELFGYAQGAFTGSARGGKIGLIESAHKGTLFLDEIGELPVGLQVKLLHVLEEHTIRKLGTVEERALDIRILASTNRNLEKEVEEGSFRRDLYYRLNVVPVIIPPLRERIEDIGELLDHYLEMFNKQYGTEKILSSEVLDVLQNYTWLGNVRELANLVERLIITTTRDMIELEDLPQSVTTSQRILKGRENNEPIMPTAHTVRPLREMLDTFEKTIIRNALERFPRQEDAAAALKISMSTLTRKHRKHRPQDHPYG